MYLVLSLAKVALYIMEEESLMSDMEPTTANAGLEKHDFREFIKFKMILV